MSAETTIIPAATVLLLRDSPANGLEVFMVVRHHQIDFASGALVFPGGKLAKGDTDPALVDYCDGAEGFSPELLSLRVCAIRESFEECGVLLARAAGQSRLVGPDIVSKYDHWRKPLDKGEATVLELLQASGLRLALDAMVPFAHWITPEFMPKRFDTHFYLAAASDDQLALHDGHENVDSTWVSPRQVLQEAEEGKWTIIFPTRLNIEKLAKATSVRDALERAEADNIVLVTPWVDNAGEQPMLRIRDNAGYDTLEETIERAIPKPK